MDNTSYTQLRTLERECRQAKEHAEQYRETSLREVQRLDDTLLAISSQIQKLKKELNNKLLFQVQTARGKGEELNRLRVTSKSFIKFWD